MIPPDRNRNIVDIVLDIMDRRPRPMKKLKVTEKNRNCVDRFRDAHQAEYEAREKLSEHDVERVKQHNMTYPRLGDELNKRKSLSKVVRTIEQNNDSSKKQNDVECAAYTKLRRLSQLQKHTLKPKCKQRKKKSKTRYRVSKSRIQKNSNKNQKRVKSRKTISVNKKYKCRCYYICVNHKRVGTDMTTNLQVKPKICEKSNGKPIERMFSTAGKFIDASKERINSKERIDCLMPKRESVNDLKSEDERSEHSTINTLNNPDKSVASISTFNTFASVDQEPMVNMEL